MRKGFIAAILGKNPETIRRTTLIPTSLRIESEEDKLGILDVLVELEDEAKMNMKMQVSYFECWTNRVLFYLGKYIPDRSKRARITINCENASMSAFSILFISLRIRNAAGRSERIRYHPLDEIPRREESEGVRGHGEER